MVAEKADHDIKPEVSTTAVGLANMVVDLKVSPPENFGIISVPRMQAYM